MESLKGKNVFITGASAGIGKSCAEYFAKEGANLILTARRKEKIDELGERLANEFGIKTLSLSLDVKNYDDVKSLVDKLEGEWSKIDILINNAGLARGFGHITEDDPKNWDDMIDTNIKGLLNVTKVVVNKMNEQNSGHVINLGSTAGYMSYANGAVYCSTKFAVRAISDALRIETLSKNIRVSSVDPGAVETDFSKVRFGGDEEKAKNVYNGMQPLNWQ